MKIATIIVTYNRLKLNRLAVASHMHSTRKRHATLIVVDNGSTDGTLEWLTEFHQAGFINKLWPMGKNAYLGPAWNAGFRLTDGYDYVGKVDNDYYFDMGWIENMISVIQKTDPACVIVAADGIIQQERRQYPEYTKEIDGIKFLEGPAHDQGGSYYLKRQFLINHDISLPNRSHMTNFTNGYVMNLIREKGGRIVRLLPPYLSRKFERYADPDLEDYYRETFQKRGRLAEWETWRKAELEGGFKRGDIPFKRGGSYV